MFGSPRTIATTVAAIVLALAACGKKSSSPPPTGGQGSAKPDAAPGPTVDATAQPANRSDHVIFGRPSRSHPDVLDRIEAGPNGLVLTCSARATRLWNADGTLRWGRSGEFRGRACALSADGTRVAMLERKGAEGTPYELHVVPVGGGADSWAPGPQAALALRFVGDDVLSVALDQVQLWTDGKASPVVKLSGPARTAAFSADGKTVVWSDGVKVSLQPTTGSAAPVPVVVDSEIKRLALSPDGTRLALGSDRKVTLWDVPAGNVLWTAKADLTVPHSPAVAFDGDGRVLASYVSEQVTLGADGTWPARSPHPRFVEWGPDGAARVLDGKVEFLVNVENGGRTPAPAHTTPDWADNRDLGVDGVLTAWTSEGCSPFRATRAGAELTLPAPTGCAPEATTLQGWRAGPTRAVAVGSSVVVYDLTTGKALGPMARGDRPLDDLALSADGTTALMVLGLLPSTDDPSQADAPERKQRALAVWRLGANAPTQGAQSLWPGDEVRTSALSPDGKRAYLGLSSGHVAVVDTSSLKQISLLGPQSSTITQLSVDSTSGRIAATDLDHATVIYPP